MSQSITHEPRGIVDNFQSLHVSRTQPWQPAPYTQSPLHDREEEDEVPSEEDTEAQQGFLSTVCYCSSVKLY